MGQCMRIHFTENSQIQIIIITLHPPSVNFNKELLILVCKVNKYHLLLLPKSAPKNKFNGKMFSKVSNSNFFLKGKKWKVIGSLTTKLMGCYKIHTSQQSSFLMKYYFHLLWGPWHTTAQWTALQALWAAQYFEHSISAGKLIKQQERATIRVISEGGWLESSEGGLEGWEFTWIASSMVGIKQKDTRERKRGIGGDLVKR